MKLLLKLPGLLWVGFLGFLAWKKFGPQIRDRLRAATADSPPSAGTVSGDTGAAADSSPVMAVAADLAPANAAPQIPDPVSEPDPAPVTTTG
jgi:hypothetical protein